MPTNVDQAAQRNKELNENQTYKKTKWYKWKPGKNTLRILPGYDPRHCDAQPDFTTPTPEGAKDFFAVECKKANKVGPNNRTVILGPNPGPLEEYIDQLNAQGDEASKKEADAIRPRNRALFFVIDRDNEAEGPQCLDWNLIEYNKILGIVADPEYGDIACPFNGCDLVIEYVHQDKSSNGFAQWPSILARRNSSPLTQDGNYWHEWLGTDFFEETGAGKPTDPAYIRACIAGTDKDFNKSDEGAVNSAPAASAPTPTGASTVGPTCQHPFMNDLDKQFWMTSGGQAIEASAFDVAAHVQAGQDPQIMPHDQSAPWGPASSFGFVLVQPQPAQAAPPAAAAPPAPAGNTPPAPSAAPPSTAAPAAPPASTGTAAPPQPPAGGTAAPGTASPALPPPPQPNMPAAPPLPGVPTSPPSPAGGGDDIPFNVPPSEAEALNQQLQDAASAGTESAVGQDLRSALSG